MELLNQFDVQNPDHVSVITKEGKLTVSILKDGSSVTLGFPVKSAWLDTTPRPPLQQSAPREKAVKSQATNLVIKKKVRISFIAKKHRKGRAPKRLAKFAAKVRAGKVRRNRKGRIIGFLR